MSGFSLRFFFGKFIRIFVADVNPVCRKNFGWSNKIMFFGHQFSDTYFQPFHPVCGHVIQIMVRDSFWRRLYRASCRVPLYSVSYYLVVTCVTYFL